MVPLLSLAATSVAPFSSRNRAAWLSHIPKAFDSDRRTFDFEITQGSCHFRTFRQSVSRGADLIKGNSSKHTRKPARSTNFVMYPAHTGLVRSHIRTRNVLHQDHE